MKDKNIQPRYVAVVVRTIIGERRYFQLEL